VRSPDRSEHISGKREELWFMADDSLERWRRGGYGILAALFACDVITTTIDRMYGHHELNPLMVPFVTDPVVFFVVKFIAFAIIVGLVESCCLVLKKTGRYSRSFQIFFLAAILLLNVYYAYGVISNIRVMLGPPHVRL